MKVGLKQISEKSGFSLATVSNVLNNKKGVNPETARRIREIAHELGYLTQEKIKSVKLIIYKKHGTVVSETPFFSSLIEGIEGECRANSLTLEICRLHQAGADFDTVLRAIQSDVSSAVLLLATEMDSTDLAQFSTTLAPLVVLDNWFPSMQYSAVLINNTDSVCGAVHYLFDHGHTRVGYLQTSVPINNFLWRAEGFYRAFRERGIAPDPALVANLEPTIEGSYSDMLRFLEKRPPMPTAYFADNDIIALGALRALREHGYRIPEDISIVGFDDMPYCEVSSPALTTVRVPKQDMGSQAVRALLHRVEHPEEAKTRTEMSTTLTERDSVRILK